MSSKYIWPYLFQFSAVFDDPGSEEYFTLPHLTQMEYERIPFRTLRILAVCSDWARNFTGRKASQISIPSPSSVRMDSEWSPSNSEVGECKVQQLEAVLNGLAAVLLQHVESV
jgi:hypothetical protein